MPSRIDKKILKLLPKEEKKPKNYKLLFYSFLANVVLFALVVKLINKNIGLSDMFWALVCVHLVAIVHELGHIVVWRLKGVKIIDYTVIPLFGFGIKPDPRAMGKLQPLTIILASLMGPVVNLAVGLYFLDIPGWHAWLFMAMNLAAFATNFMALPLTDGAYNVLHTLRVTMSVNLSFWRMLGVTFLVLLFFLYWKHVLIWTLIIGALMSIQIITLHLRKETKLIYINALPLEVISGVFTGLAIVTFHQMFWVALLTKLSIWWPMAGYYLGW